MGELPMASLTAIVRSWVINSLSLVRGARSAVLRKASPEQSTERSCQPDPNALNCRVQLRRGDNGGCDVFGVEICGSIHAPSDMHEVSLRILMTDVTDGVEKAKPVHSCMKQWQMQNSPDFVYSAGLGKLPNANNVVSDWMSVAQIECDWLAFARKGKRELEVSVSILSREDGEDLGFARCTFSYENAAFGYVDLQENVERVKTLAVALAFAVSAADNKLYDCEIEVIKKWARDNVGTCEESDRARRKLEKALDKTVEFFRDANQLDSFKICKEIVEIVPVGERYDILELCLRVAQANGRAAVEEVALLKRLAGWLEVDMDRFRRMMERILPVNMHEVEDTEVILGVTSDMGKEETRRRLNEEYRKWNARVTSSDPEVQCQADLMLKLIADARSEYVSQEA